MALSPKTSIIATVLLGAVLLTAAGGPANAQPATAPAKPVDEAPMMAAMDRMSQAMAAAKLTGNPDADFVAMMIPHHAGAIDMAQFELDHGTDPALRHLAATIIKAQQAEIAEMKAWQQTH